MVRRRIILPMLSLLTFIPACSGPSLVNAFVPRNGYHAARDVAYGQGPRRTLDLYVPTGASSDVPLIVFFYGGSWDSGSKNLYRFVGQAFAARGYATAVPDYRIYPEVRFPAFVEDGAAAVAWLRQHGEAYGVGSGPIYLVGHSAGAYIAAMLALDERWLAGAGVERCNTIKAAVGLSGPYDFLPLTSQRLREVFGPEPAGAGTQPITYVDGRAPPMQLAAGTGDTTVRPENTLRLAARIRAAGGTVEERMYEDVSHVGMIARLAPVVRRFSPLLDEIDRFLQRHADSGC